MGRIIWQLCLIVLDIVAITIDDNSAIMRCVLGIFIAILGVFVGFAVADML